MAHTGDAAGDVRRSCFFLRVRSLLHARYVVRRVGHLDTCAARNPGARACVVRLYYGPGTTARTTFKLIMSHSRNNEPLDFVCEEVGRPRQPLRQQRSRQTHVQHTHTTMYFLLHTARSNGTVIHASASQNCQEAKGKVVFQTVFECRVTKVFLYDSIIFKKGKQVFIPIPYPGAAFSPPSITV